MADTFPETECMKGEVALRQTLLEAGELIEKLDDFRRKVKDLEFTLSGMLPKVRLGKYRGTTTGRGVPTNSRISIDGKLLVVKYAECDRRMGKDNDYAPATKRSLKIGLEECAYFSTKNKWQVFMRHGKVVGGEGEKGIYHLDTIKV